MLLTLVCAQSKIIGEDFVKRLQQLAKCRNHLSEMEAKHADVNADMEAIEQRHADALGAVEAELTNTRAQVASLKAGSFADDDGVLEMQKSVAGMESKLNKEELLCAKKTEEAAAALGSLTAAQQKGAEMENKLAEMEILCAKKTEEAAAALGSLIEAQQKGAEMEIKLAEMEILCAKKTEEAATASSRLQQCNSELKAEVPQFIICVDC